MFRLRTRSGPRGIASNADAGAVAVQLDLFCSACHAIEPMVLRGVRDYFGRPHTIAASKQKARFTRGTVSWRERLPEMTARRSIETPRDETTIYSAPHSKRPQPFACFGNEPLRLASDREKIILIT